MSIIRVFHTVVRAVIVSAYTFAIKSKMFGRSVLFIIALTLFRVKSFNVNYLFRRHFFQRINLKSDRSTHLVADHKEVQVTSSYNTVTHLHTSYI